MKVIWVNVLSVCKCSFSQTFFMSLWSPENNAGREEPVCAPEQEGNLPRYL